MSGPFSDEVPSEIAATDRLGRGEWSRRSARRSFRKRMERRGNRVPVSRFMPPEGSNEISVDRLGLASDITMAEIGARNARNLGKEFWGWYVLTAKEVEEEGCTIRPSPLLDNAYHADIMLPVPSDAEDRQDALREHAMGLAYHATFQPWGEWTQDVT